jgi:hypothetical protein
VGVPAAVPEDMVPSAFTLIHVAPLHEGRHVGTDRVPDTKVGHLSTQYLLPIPWAGL